MAGNKKSGITLRNTMTDRYMAKYPDLTKEEAYEAWKDDLRANAAKGGRVTGVAKGFAHPNSDPSAMGKLGGRGKKRETK